MGVVAKSFNTNNPYVLKNAMLTGAISVLNRVSASSTNGVSARMDTLTFNSVSNGSVSISNTPVIVIPVSGSTVTISYLMLGEYDAVNEWNNPYLDFKIDDEEFEYEGSITIDGVTLSMSSTIG